MIETEIRKQIQQSIRALRRPTLDFLKEIVAVNSFSRNKDGVDKVGEIVTREIPKSFSPRVIKNRDLGDHHIFSHLKKGVAPIVLVGHLDTLCPEDSSFNRLVEKRGKLVGPGVNDMKGGDTVIVWALQTLEACNQLRDKSIVCIFNGDEELGSPTSNTLFSGMRGQASFGLVFECGGPEETIVTTRKGIARFRLHITGRPHHFGNLKERKISAIEEIANKILAVEKINHQDGSIVTNVGRVEGGLAANVVAERASMDFEVRYWTPKTEKKALSTVAKITHASSIPDCRLRIERLSYRPPLQPDLRSRRLFRQIVSLGTSLNQRIKEEKRGGVSDANWLSYARIPTIDGLGPIGDLDCTKDEYILKETLYQRIELASNLILQLSTKK